MTSDLSEQLGATELADPIPISALQHAVYCLRQAALIHIERVWAENRFTAEGRVLHEVTHEAGTRRERGVRRVTALPLAYLGWFIGPWVFIGSTASVLVIVWRRQFSSDALAALSNLETSAQTKH